MKTILISNNQRVYNLVYKVYHWLLFGPLKDFKNEKSYKHNVYDKYDIIDTLGFRYDEGKYTFGYSEELNHYAGIKLPFGYCLEFGNEWEIYIEFKKFKSLFE
jgi:hypothetical protein